MQTEKYKVLVCGKTHTGKTSIIRQYIDHNFIAKFFPTVLPMAESQKFRDSQGNYELNIWDTAGAEEWQSMNASVYHASHVIVFVASFDDKDSLSELTAKWVPALENFIELDKAIKILAVNKRDILDEEPDMVQVTNEDLEDTGRQLQATMFKVSAKTNEKVNDIFEFAGREARKVFGLDEKAQEIKGAVRLRDNKKRHKNNRHQKPCHH